MKRFIWWILIVLPLFFVASIIAALTPITAGLPLGVLLLGWAFQPRRTR